MKGINKVFNAITVSLFMLTAIGIAGSYLSDYLIDINWFGDYEEYNAWSGTMVTKWGVRHYWYNWGVRAVICSHTF